MQEKNIFLLLTAASVRAMISTQTVEEEEYFGMLFVSESRRWCKRGTKRPEEWASEGVLDRCGTGCFLPADAP